MGTGGDEGKERRRRTFLFFARWYCMVILSTVVMAGVPAFFTAMYGKGEGILSLLFSTVFVTAICSRILGGKEGGFV